MLNESTTKGTVPSVKNMLDRVKTFSAEDRKEFLELFALAQEADDQEEYESLLRAMEEILEQKPIIVDPFPLDEQPMGEGLKKWATHVASKVKELREKAGMSIEALATAADLPPEYVEQIEGVQESASNIALSKIAKALHVDVGVIDPIAD